MKNTPKYQIILKNDDKNSFEGVMQSLSSICNHNLLQAEQCASLVHHIGQCSVKDHLEYDEAEKILELLIEDGLTVSIDISN